MKHESRTSRGHLVAGLGTRCRRAFLLLAVGSGLAFRLGARALRGRLEARELGRELRRFCEGMGITYIKLGQYLAMRFDVLPLEACRELTGLLEDVPPMDFETVRTILEAELGVPPEKAFAELERQPLAAASVAQVHRARAHDGEQLAVKVQRPNLDRVFAADIRNLLLAAWGLDQVGALGGTSLVAAVEEFADFTAREMDFVTEGRTADRLRRNAAPTEHVPRIRWDLTTRRVISMELVAGISMSVLCRMIEEGRHDEVKAVLPNADLETLTRNFIRASLRQLFLHGFFHADPHPGNILVRDDNSVAFVDFGIFGELSPTERKHCAGYVENVSLRRFDRAFQHYMHMVDPTPDADLEGFRAETLRLMNHWYATAKDPAAPVVERHMGTFINNTLRLYHRFRVRLALDMLLYWRAIFLLDSTALRLARHVDLLSEMEAFFTAHRRPLPLQLEEILLAPERHRELEGLTRRGPGALLANRSSRERKLILSRKQATWSRREQSRRAVAWSLAVVGISLAVLALGATGSASALGLGAGAAALSLRAAGARR